MANSWEDLGKQVAVARKDRGLTQVALAEAIGVDRTAVTKIETGERKLDSLELARVAQVLGRPIHWFVRAPVPAVVSRRAEMRGAPRPADIALENLVLDVEQLVQLGGLETAPLAPIEVSSLADTEQAAKVARERAGLGPREAAWELIRVVERLGLFAFVLPLEHEGDAPAEGSYIALTRGGVALISAEGPSGRRRFTLAHELGHHVLADQYASEWVLGASNSEREKVINAFAIHFLMPREAVQARWKEAGGLVDPRGAAIRISAELGTSWTAACAQLERFGFVTSAQQQQLAAVIPSRFEMIEQQAVIRDDVQGPCVPPAYAAAVIRALRRGKIGPQRALELLHGTMKEHDLPPPRELSLNEMRADFQPLP